MKHKSNKFLGILAALILLASLLVPSLPAMASSMEIISPKVPADTYNCVWGTASNDVFAGGAMGTILHYDGTDWSEMESGTPYSISAIWGTASNDVFAGGAMGVILRYDGTEWSAMTSPTTQAIKSIWGTASNDVFAVGYYGVILHYNGTEWSTMTSPTTNNLFSVWGSASNDVFAVGKSGVILHYDGSSWRAMTSGTTVYINGVWGTASNDVFAVGRDGTILHYNGTEWSAMTSGTTNGLVGIWGTAADDIFVTGSSGTILHYNGTDWSSMNSGTSKNLIGIWGSAANDVFAVGYDSTFLHYDGIDWETQVSVIFTVGLRQIWGSSSSDVFFVGEDCRVLHYDGASWSTTTLLGSGGTAYGLRDVWGSAVDDVFVVGFGGSIHHYNGTDWVLMDSGPSHDLFGVWGSAANDVFAVGYNGVILHYNGTEWSQMASGTTENLNAVWGSASNDVFAVGNSGIIQHYDGTDWSAMTSGTTQIINGVWGSASNDVFAVCYDGVILHYNGTEWSQMTSGTTQYLWDIWGTASNDVFVAGSGGTILHYDGSEWSAISSGVTATLRGVWGDGNGIAYFGGGDAHLLKYTYEIPGPNTPPVADDQSITIPFNTGVAITLTASDVDEDPLTYSIVDNPDHGTLSGTPPEVTYTPNTDYSGPDSFTFRAYDGKVYSNTATVNITVSETSPFAVQVVDFDGSFGSPPYDDPEAVLGKPATQCKDSWAGGTYRIKLMQNAYNVDLDDKPVITTINSGEYITVRFDHRVMNDPDNPYGIDFLVFGNDCIFGSGMVDDTTDMDTYMLTASDYPGPVTVAVSQDNETWYEFTGGPYADDMFPTQAYEWDNVNHVWTDNEMDFTKPVDPLLTLADFGGLTGAQAIALYDGSGGGTGYNLDNVGGGLDWIQYVKVTSSAGEVDAFADVASYTIPSQVSMKVSPASQTVDSGDNFTVEIQIETDTMTRGGQCDVTFDPDLIQVESVEEGAFYSDWASANGATTFMLPPTVDNENGIINDAAVSVLGGPEDEGPTGNGSFIVINITAVADGVSPIALVETFIDDVDAVHLDHTIGDGEVIVGEVQGPDLVVSEKYEEWVNESEGTYEVTYTITNQGTEDAVVSTTQVDIDGDVTTYDCPALEFGASDTKTVGPFTLTDGDDVITVTADIDDDVAEGNEGNNSKQNTILPSAMVIEGNTVKTIIITVPYSISGWELPIGENTREGILNVKCNTNWQATVSDTDITTGGHMTEWNGSAYGTEFLGEQMVVKCFAEGTSIGLESSGVIADGGPTANDGEDVGLTFNQTVGFGDPVLPDGSVYRIVIIFTGSTTF